MNIRLKKSEQKQITGCREVYDIMRRILMRESRIDRTREHFWVISLNNGQKILNIELISMGSVRATIVEPMEVFSVPLQKRAVKIILVHNHPSGNLEPSKADKDITDRLIQCGIMMHIEVVDHIIISKEFYRSFRAIGLMDELAKSLKYVPPYKIKEMAAKEADIKIKKAEAALKDKVYLMAKTMKKDGESISKIMQYTGLSRYVISRIK